jgi:hypothetical protein
VSRIIALIAFCLLPFISPGCEKVPLLAPTGSTIFLTLGESTNLGLNSSVQVSAVVTEQGGTPPHNGTVVTFTTTLGSVNPIEARTTNGIATTTFHTGNRSGTATLRAFSGGAGTGDSTAEASVAIGGAVERVIALRAESISGNGTVTVIVASVVDADGNPVVGVPVAFDSNNGVIAPGLVTTDSNGEARATLTTSEETTVTARVGTTSGTITIGAPGSIALVVTTPAPPATAEVGSPVIFTITPTGAFFTDVVIDFGDGQQQNIGTVSAARTFSHTYNQRGTFTVTARATSANGVISPATTSITVADRAPLALSLAGPTAPISLATTQGLATLTATIATQPGVTTAPVSRVEWSFGDNTPVATGTALTINHRYASAGTFIATVRVITTDGREASASTTIRVIP